ncbi:MAG: asparagine synthase (glutamine-hydrolyzing) [Deltaproteobacteria bacterium]|nr:asparagine synthase (glutamine-hydrolyzing) [Deltaproteobacteria bacterium]
MCGLVALFEPGRQFAPELLAAMDADLHHRGPDSAGCVQSPGFALIFRRLSILDTRAEADQPMSDPTGRFTLIFNGEIYNYRRLRAELEAAGCRFRTTGDTEVLLQGIATWGEGVLDRLEGMFAFVVIDRKENTVLAARDPLGIKPLYLLRKGNTIALASEARPLRRIVDRGVDRDALAELLMFRFAAGRLSNYAGIDRVPPGTAIRFSLDGSGYRERCYGDVLGTIRPQAGADWNATIDSTEAGIRQSVEDHLASDVGYAVQLSGGIDSSLVTLLAVEKSKAPVHSFGLYLGDTPHDERQFRNIVVARTKTVHHEIPIDGAVVADAFPRAVHHMEGPSPHLGCILLMVLCDAVRDITKVVLTGEGADEFFGGYQRYERWRDLQRYRRFARLVPTALWPLLKRYRAISIYARHEPAVYASVFSDYLDLAEVFPALVPKPGGREHAAGQFRDFRDKMFAVDQTAYLESLLLRQDKMAMAASVEARVPFTHMPLARLVNTIPRDLRAPGGVTKPVLKAVAERYFPADFVHRRKVGLTLPLREWLGDSRGLGRYLDLVSDPNSELARYGEARHLTGLVARFRAGELGIARILVHLINLELWLRDAAQPLPAAERPRVMNYAE